MQSHSPFSLRTSSATVINVDSDSTSTSSQTSSEHDPQIAPLTTQTHVYQVSPTTNWPDERTSFFATNSLASSQTTSTTATKPVSPSMNAPVTAMLASPKAPTTTTTANHNLLTESTNNNNHNNNATVKNFDQVPEYKLFSSNIPSIHTLLFGNNENSQWTQASQRPLMNGSDHDVREIEKRLMGTKRSHVDLVCTRLLSSCRE